MQLAFLTCFKEEQIVRRKKNTPCTSWWQLKSNMTRHTFCIIFSQSGTKFTRYVRVRVRVQDRVVEGVGTSGVKSLQAHSLSWTSPLCPGALFSRGDHDGNLGDNRNGRCQRQEVEWTSNVTGCEGLNVFWLLWWSTR